MSSALEALLVAALDAEWAAQSRRKRPLVASPFVRETLELAVAGTAQGIFCVAAAVDGDGDTPETLVQGMRAYLPPAPHPWTLRVLGRMRSLPAPAVPAPLERPQEADCGCLPEPAPERASTGPGLVALVAPATARAWRPAIAASAAAALALAAAAWLAGDALLGAAALPVLSDFRQRAPGRTGA